MAFDPRAGSGIAGDTLVHHLNMTADVERGSMAEFSGCEFIFSLSEDVSKQVINVLQDFFQATKLGRMFNNRLKKVNKEVIIMDEFAPDTQPMPQVVVKSIPVDHTPVSLGNRLGMEPFGDQLFVVYGGLATMNTTLDIYDTGKASVCALADVIFLSLMQYVRDRLAQLTITIQPQIRFTTAQKITGLTVGGEVYRISLSVTIVSNWKQFLEVDTVSTDTIETQPTPVNA